jgi:RNA polymerase sigma-70 factor, ECF subfamily
MARTRRLRDPSLVRRAQHGDRRAFLALLNRYDTRLRELAHGLLVDQRRVDTAMRVAYLKAWRDVVRVGPRDDVGTWLYRNVYNACIDELRREPRPAGEGRSEGDEPEVAPATDPRDRAALARRVVDGLRSLRPEQRVALVLVDREGFSPEAAARIQGLTTAVLSARLQAARRAFADHVGVVDLSVVDDRPAQEAEAVAGDEPAQEAEAVAGDEPAQEAEAVAGDEPAQERAADGAGGPAADTDRPAEGQATRSTRVP